MILEEEMRKISAQYRFKQYLHNEFVNVRDLRTLICEKKFMDPTTSGNKYFKPKPLKKIYCRLRHYDSI